MAAADQPSVRSRFEQLPAHVTRVDRWTDVASPADRRRIQNRINQRALRKRKRAAGMEHDHANEPSLKECAAPTDKHKDMPRRQMESRSPGPLTQSPTTNLWQMLYSAMAARPVNRSALMVVAEECPVHTNDLPQVIEGFEAWLYAASTGSPDRNALFTLIQFNVFRALVCNARYLGISDTHALDDDSISIVSDPKYHKVDGLPASLWPTDLQKTQVHHPWIDLLPLPKMRDNILLARDSYDEEELCTGLLGCSLDCGDKTGVVVWGEAWDPAGWELTEEFLRRWGWTVRGCDELFRSTNHWRRVRGKKPLKLGDSSFYRTAAEA